MSKLVLAKMAAQEGNYKFALRLFRELQEQPSSLNMSSERESGFAYLNYEYALLLEKLGDEQGVSLFQERSLSMARSNKLKHLLHLRHLRAESLAGRKSPLREWFQEIAYFNKYGMDVMEISARLELAGVYARMGELAEAAGHLDEIHLLASEKGYGYLMGMIDLSRAEILVLQGRNKEALIYLKSLEPRFACSEIKAKLQFRMAQLLEDAGQIEDAIAVAKACVELSLRFGVLPYLALSSDFLGRHYHRSKADLTKGFFYYQKAYGAILELQQLGLPIQGHFAEVLVRYITFLEEHFPGEIDESANEDLFAFSRGMKWVPLKDLFHYNLFLYHYTNTGVGSRTLEVLDIPASSFYSATERLRSRGITFPNFRKSKVEIPSENYVEGLQQYCRLHRELTWVQINDRFEKDMLAYHYKLNNYNKKLMAQQLDLAYSGIVNRTQYLTSSKT